MRDFTFRSPPGSHPLRKRGALAVGVSTFPGVEKIVDDPNDGSLVHVVCDRSTWACVLTAVARHDGLAPRDWRRSRTRLRQ